MFRNRRRWSAAIFLFVAIAGIPAARAAEQTEADKQLIAASGLFQQGMYKLAAEEYEQFLSRFPKHDDAASARYALAVCRYRLNDYAKASELLTAVLADPRFATRDEALAVLGHCRLTLNDQAGALAAFDELLAKHPESKHAEGALMNRAQVLYLANKRAEAKEACEQFLKRYPNSAQRVTAMYFLALARSGLGEHAAAAQVLGVMLQRYPNSPYQIDAMLLLGQCVEAQGQLDAAAEQYRQLVRIAPPARQPDARFSLGLVLHKSGKYDQAAKELAAMLASPEGQASRYAAPARLQLGLSQVAAAQYDEARRNLNQVIREDKERAATARFALAQCDLAERKYEAARTTLEEMLKGNPPAELKPQLAFQLALCLMGLEQFEPAAGAFAQFRKDFPADPQAAESTYRQAFCLHKLGKFDQSHALCAQLDRSTAAGRSAMELDAENLFLLKQYAEADKAYAALEDAEKDLAKRARFTARRGQSMYFAANYAKAVELLAPLSQAPRAANDPALQEATFLLGDALLQMEKHAEAAEALARYLRIVKGEHPEARYKLALAQMRAGQINPAERTLEQMLKNSPQSEWTPRALLELAQLQVKQDRPQKAVEPLRKIATLKAPEEVAAPAAYLLAWIDLDGKRYSEAAAQFKAILEKHPKHAVAADAAFQLGVALKEAGQADAAATALQGYLSQYPAGTHATQARQLLASVQVRQNKPEEAVKTLSAMAADDKTRSAVVLYDLAWAHRGTKNNAGAAEAYRRLLADFATSDLATPAGVELADLLYQDAKYADAIALLEKALQGKADAKVLSAGLYRLGLCYEKSDNSAKAATAFADFAQRYPADELTPSALLQAGSAFIAQKRFADAEKQFAELAKRFPKHELAPTALLKLGEVQNELGNYDVAARTFQSYLDAYPRDKFTHLAQFGIGWSFESRSRYDDARLWYGKVLSTHNGPTAARAQFQVGQTWLKQQKLEEAVKKLLAVEDVYASPEWSPPALLDAGRALEGLGQPQQAATQYRRLIDKYKTSKAAQDAAKRLKALGAAAGQ